MALSSLHASEKIMVLDIGSSKIACGVAEVRHGTWRILGLGYHASSGVRGGMITDMGRLQHAISRTIHQAEDQSRETIRRVWVSVSGQHLHAQRRQGVVSLQGKPVTSSDMASALSQTMHVPSFHDTLIHNIPLSFSVDQSTGIVDPIGLSGAVLEAYAYNIYAPSTYLKNIQTCLSRCHIDIQGFVHGPYMGTFSCLTEEEREIGCVLVDMGAALTTVSMIHGGCFVYTHSIPLGAQHITQDIAQAFSLSFAHAERLKVLHGLLPEESQDENLNINMLSLNHSQDASLALHTSLAGLKNVIEARVDEILDFLGHVMHKSGFSPYVGQHLVLSGGGAQLKGMKERASMRLGKSVRISGGGEIEGLHHHPNACGLVGMVGMLHYVHIVQEHRNKELKMQRHHSLFKKMRIWFKENV